MADIMNVVVLGATGNVGQPVVKALALAGFTVTAASRSRIPLSTFPASVRLETADYSSHKSLLALFTGQDAIVQAFNPAAAAVHHTTITDAAILGGIKHIITPDFCTDTFNSHVPELEIFEPKLQAQKYLEEKIKGTGVKWTGIVTGPFYDWAIRKGIFWITPGKRTVTTFGSGNQKVSMSRIDIAGRATVAVLSNREKYTNRPAYFADYTVSTNELVDMVREISDEKWNTANMALMTFFKDAKKAYAKDTEDGVEDRLNSVAYQMLGTYGVFEEANRYNANFEEMVEEGWGRPMSELKDELKLLL